MSNQLTIFRLVSYLSARRWHTALKSMTAWLSRWVIPSYSPEALEVGILLYFLSGPDHLERHVNWPLKKRAGLARRYTVGTERCNKDNYEALRTKRACKHRSRKTVRHSGLNKTIRTSYSLFQVILGLLLLSISVYRLRERWCMSKSVYVCVVHGELLRYVLRCAIGRQL